MTTSSKISRTPNWPETIFAKRAVLRRIAIDDALEWKKFNNAIKKRMPEWPQVPSIIYAKNEILNYIEMWDEKERFIYTISDKKTGEIVGDFHIKFFERKRRRMEFGHALHPKVWGTGFTYEVLDGVQKVAKKLKIILWCKIEEENIRSWKSIEKYGAQYKWTRTYLIQGKKYRMRVYDL